MDVATCPETGNSHGPAALPGQAVLGDAKGTAHRRDMLACVLEMDRVAEGLVVVSRAFEAHVVAAEIVVDSTAQVAAADTVDSFDIAVDSREPGQPGQPGDKMNRVVEGEG